MSDIVQKLWGFCHTLRHDGIDYGDYIEQLTYLLFLKMADERGIDLSHTKMRTEKNREIEVDCSWPTLEEKSGTALTDHYVDVLRALGQQTGLLGDIFAGALSRFQNPVNLKKLIGAVFDTAFHRTIPNRARFYAIPWELTQRYRIQRFGFHGIPHNYLMLR